MQKSTSSSSVILPAAVLALFFMAIGAVLILTFRLVMFLISWSAATFFAAKATPDVVTPEQAMAQIMDEVIAEAEGLAAYSPVEVVAEEVIAPSSPELDDVVAEEIAVAPSSPELEAVAEVVNPLQEAQDETLVTTLSSEQALQLLQGLTRPGWKTMLNEIKDRANVTIPSNFRQMSKNKSRAQALLELNVSIQVLEAARKAALRTKIS
jgi:hypothetical protein